jgi:hypothetical protein
VSDFKRGLFARFLHDDRENMPPKTLDALIIIHDFLLRTTFEVVLTDVQAERGGWCWQWHGRE